MFTGCLSSLFVSLLCLSPLTHSHSLPPSLLPPSLSLSLTHTLSFFNSLSISRSMSLFLTVYLVGFEIELVDFLVGFGFGDDDFLAIDHEARHLVGEDATEDVDPVICGDFAEHLCEGCVLVTRFNHADGKFSTGVGSLHKVGDLAGNFFLALSFVSYYYCVGSYGDVAVDVDTQVDLYNVSLCQYSHVPGQWRKMTNYVIN